MKCKEYVVQELGQKREVHADKRKELTVSVSSSLSRTSIPNISEVSLRHGIFQVAGRRGVTRTGFEKGRHCRGRSA